MARLRKFLLAAAITTMAQLAWTQPADSSHRKIDAPEPLARSMTQADAPPVQRHRLRHQAMPGYGMKQQAADKEHNDGYTPAKREAQANLKVLGSASGLQPWPGFFFFDR